jgi:hypothetical protein
VLFKHLEATDSRFLGFDVAVVLVLAGPIWVGDDSSVKHCAQNALYTLQHIGYTIPPQADAGRIGEAGPGPSYLDAGCRWDFANPEYR